MRLARPIPRQQALFAIGALTYAFVLALFLLFERPGLGIGHGFYLAVIFVALAGGPRSGLAAGVLATALYAWNLDQPSRLPRDDPYSRDLDSGCHLRRRGPRRRLARQSEPGAEREAVAASR